MLMETQQTMSQGLMVKAFRLSKSLVAFSGPQPSLSPRAKCSVAMVHTPKVASQCHPWNQVCGFHPIARPSSPPWPGCRCVLHLPPFFAHVRLCSWKPEVHGVLSLLLSTVFSFFVYLGFFVTGSYYTEQADLELLVILLPQPPECWDCRCELP